MRKRWMAAIAVAAGILGASPVRADHVAAYSSYSGPFYNPNGSRSIFGQAGGDIIFPVICQPYPYCSGGNQEGTNAFAFQFTALHTGVLEAIWVTLWNRDNWEGTEASARVSLLADAAGEPGGPIGSWDLLLTNLAPYSYEIVNGDDAIVLAKDLVYWLRVDPLTDLSAVAWYHSYRNDGEGRQITAQGTYYGGSLMPAMAVYVLVPVPEAAAAPATLAAVAALGWLRRRR